MERSYETITDCSDVAEWFCREYLEATANHLAGENFRASKQAEIDITFKSTDEEDLALQLRFVARKQHSQQGDLYVTYNVTVTSIRPYDMTYYFPMFDNQYQGSEVEQDEEADEDGAVVTYVHEDDDEEDLSPLEIDSTWMIHEVSDYFMTDREFMPRKDVRVEYYDPDNRLSDMFAAHDPSRATEMMFSEAPDEDIDLQTLDTSMHSSFSAADIEEIHTVLAKFGLAARPHRLY